MNLQGAVSLTAPRQSSADAMVAAAHAMRVGTERITPQNEGWQREVWDLYDELGEFRSGVTWLADAMSRVRLIAAEIDPENENGEPQPVTQGPVADLVSRLADDIGGRSEMLSTLTVFLSVPGEGYLVGEETKGGQQWVPRSSDEVRYRSRDVIEVVDENRSSGSEIVWRQLEKESLVVRIWRPHKRFHYLADSPARAARNTMRELGYANRYIVAQYLSRLASAGMVLFPNEVTFPVRPEFANEPDPFVAEWIEIARESIKTPGTAAAVVPLPIRVPGEWIDKIKHLDFTTAFDEKILEKRESAIQRLATAMAMPKEALTGYGDTNHWSAWQIEESGIKNYVAPIAELLCKSLTTGYLRARLRGDPEILRRQVIWYDTAQLTQRPDRSESAVQAYDRAELSGAAMRRELGLGDDDLTPEELREQAIHRLLSDPTTVERGLALLAGEPVAPPAPVVVQEPADDPLPSAEDLERPAEPPAPRSTVPSADLPRAASGAHRVRLPATNGAPH